MYMYTYSCITAIQHRYIPILLGALGKVREGLEKGLGELVMCGTIETIQTIKEPCRPKDTANPCERLLVKFIKFI